MRRAAADLARALDPLPDGLEFDFVRAASYRGTESSGAVALEVPRALSVAGRHILLVRTGASCCPTAIDRLLNCSTRPVLGAVHDACGGGQAARRRSRGPDSGPPRQGAKCAAPLPAWQGLACMHGMDIMPRACNLSSPCLARPEPHEACLGLPRVGYRLLC